MYYSLYCLHTTPAHGHSCTSSHVNSLSVHLCITSLWPSLGISEVHAGVTRIWFVIWGDLEQVLSHGSETEQKSTYLFHPLQQSVRPLALVMAVFNGRPYVVKTVGPVSWARFSSTEPADQNHPQTCRTLGGTPLGTGDAENTRRNTVIITLYLSLFTVAS